ncbi:hypothetical protein B4U80_14368, partial [Leptotrombidium deliense]
MEHIISYSKMFISELIKTTCFMFAPIMKMKIVFVLLVVTLVNASPFTPCGTYQMFLNLDGNSLVQSVDFEGCPDGSAYCTVQQGRTYKVTIQFISNANSNTLTASGHSKGLLVDKPLTGLDSNACDDNNIQCPIFQGQRYTYIFPANILYSYPLVKSHVIFRVKDDTGNDVICGEFP